MKIINLALFTGLDYFRRTWFYAEIILVAILLFLFKDQFRSLSKDDIYPALGIFSIIMAAVTTLRITNLEANTRIYIPLTKTLSRKDYLTGKIIAAFVLNTIILLLLFILAFFLTALKQQYSFSVGLVHLIPLCIILLLVEVIMLCCSPLVLNKMSFFWGILLLIFGSVQPWKISAFVFPPIKQLITSSYEHFNVHIMPQYLLALVYIMLFYRLALYFFSKRELNYEQK